MIYILNILNAIEKMSTKEIKDFIFENYFTHFGFTKKTVIIQRNIKKKKKSYRLQLNYLKSVYLMLVMLKNTMNYF